jgi:hypothetical protein
MFIFESFKALATSGFILKEYLLPTLTPFSEIGPSKLAAT